MSDARAYDVGVVGAGPAGLAAALAAARAGARVVLIDRGRVPAEFGCKACLPVGVPICCSSWWQGFTSQQRCNRIERGVAVEQRAVQLLEFKLK